MTTLENLYYGNIFPADKDITRGSEYSKLGIKVTAESFLTDSQNFKEI